MININRVNVFEAIADKGEPVVWCDVEWGGISKKSRKVKRPQLNETFYFELPISKETIMSKTEADLADEIMEELRMKPQITLSVWADPNNGQVESLGNSTIALRQIAIDGRFGDKTFTD